MIDYHIHSNWSLDSLIDISQAITRAEKNNFVEIAFTDHLDLGFPHSGSAILNIPAYLAILQDYAKKTSVRILKGIEVGVNKTNLAETNTLLSLFPFDFVIASIHGSDQVAYCLADARSVYGSDLVRVYLEQILFVVQNIVRFHTLAHFDYLLRYHPISLQEFLQHQNLIDQILQTVIQRKGAVEINTKGYSSLKRFHPPIEVLKRYVALGGQWVTFGSDAHQVKDIGAHYQEAKHNLEEIGIPHFARWNDTHWEAFME